MQHLTPHGAQWAAAPTPGQYVPGFDVQSRAYSRQASNGRAETEIDAKHMVIGPGDGKLQRVDRQDWEGPKDGFAKTRVIVWSAVDQAKENRSIAQHAQLKAQAAKLKRQAHDNIQRQLRRAASIDEADLNVSPPRVSSDSASRPFIIDKSGGPGNWRAASADLAPGQQSAGSHAAYFGGSC